MVCGGKQRQNAETMGSCAPLNVHADCAPGRQGNQICSRDVGRHKLLLIGSFDVVPHRANILIGIKLDYVCDDEYTTKHHRASDALLTVNTSPMCLSLRRTLVPLLMDVIPFILRHVNCKTSQCSACR
jgi:hypothetical protein